MLNIIIRYSNITANILLFGNTDLLVPVNEEIFKAVLTSGGAISSCD